MLKRVCFGFVVSSLLVFIGIPGASHATTFIDNTDYHVGVEANDLHIVYKSNGPMTIEENLLERVSENPEEEAEPLGWEFDKTSSDGGYTWECSWNKGEEGEGVNIDDWVHAGVLANGDGTRFWIETAYWTLDGAVVEILIMDPPEIGLTVGSGADEYVVKVHNPDTDTVTVPPITIYASQIPLGLNEVKPGEPPPPGGYSIVWPGFDLVPGGVETLLWPVGFDLPFFAVFQGELLRDGEVICRYAREIECTGTIPTLTEWGMIIMFVLMAAGIIWFVMRQRRRTVIA